MKLQAPQKAGFYHCSKRNLQYGIIKVTFLMGFGKLPTSGQPTERSKRYPINADHGSTNAH
jgi:hypothetical protein